MNAERSRFRHLGQEEASSSQGASVEEASGRRSFNSLEEVIGEDRAQTAVPPEVAERLNESIRKEPAPGKPWWRKLLGG